MEWEVVNGITGVISTISGIYGINFLGRQEKASIDSNSNTIISRENIAKLVIASSGWALCCLCFLLVAEPFGSYMLDSDYKIFYGWVLAFPAVVIFLTGCNLLFGKEDEARE